MLWVCQNVLIFWAKTNFMLLIYKYVKNVLFSENVNCDLARRDQSTKFGGTREDGEDGVNFVKIYIFFLNMLVVVAVSRPKRE